jgi:hypothetical protein
MASARVPARKSGRSGLPVSTTRSDAKYASVPAKRDGDLPRQARGDAIGEAGNRGLLVHDHRHPRHARRPSTTGQGDEAPVASTTRGASCRSSVRARAGCRLAR